MCLGDDLFSRQPICGAVLDTLTDRRKHRKAWTTYCYQWLCGVPLRGDAKGKIAYRNSFITDMPVGPDNVAAMVAAGRARWKIANEAFNTLKTTGYNPKHNFGHRKQPLASVLATWSLLAFACHTVLDLGAKA